MALTWQEEDRELNELLGKEKRRQSETLEMVASESLQSAGALSLAGSVFNNKTAVGNPGHQRLLGSAYADELERLAARRACEVFGADHANMITYSGSVANYCAYSAVMKLGDRAVALTPAAGSHQTHGGLSNFSSEIYDFRYFGVRKDNYLMDYEEAERLIKEHQPKLVVIGSSAYSRNIDFERLSKITHENGAKFMVDLAHFSGLVAAGVSPNPVPYADIVTISGTKTMCGPHTGVLLCTNEMADAIDRAIYPGYVSSLHLQTIAAMAYALEHTKRPEFKALMKQIVENARALANALIKRGFGIVTGGTDCHMFVADLRPLGADAVLFAEQLEKIGISVNTKGIPHDTSATPSGIRAGSIVLTQRGMKEAEMEEIADIWLMMAKDPTGEGTMAEARKKVAGLTRRFPVCED